MRYTFVKQHDATDCAAACLAMICLHYKKETTITKLRDLMGTDLKGTNLIGLSKCATELGFTNQSVRVDKEGFLSDFSLPCIANIVTDEGLSHFVVVFKKDKSHVVIGDPGKDLMRVTVDEFYRQFTGALLIIKPNESFSKGKESEEKMWGYFIKLLLPHKKLFAYTIAASLLLTILGIVSSTFNKILMDEILPYRLKNTLVMVILVFCLISVVQEIIKFIRQWMMLYLSQKIDIPLLLGYFDHIYKLPMNFFATRKTGDIITRFSDAFTIKDIFTNIALTLIMDITMALITGVILFNMNTKLFGIVVFLSIISILLVFIFKQPYKKINEEQMQQGSVLNSQIIEGLRAFETIKGNANEETELESIEREYIKSLRISLKEGMLSNMQSFISSMVQMLGNMTLTYFGIMQVINGDITLGSFMAFTTLTGYFMNPIGSLIVLQLQIQEANISMKRLTEILGLEQEKNENTASTIDSIQGDIVIKDVVFRYGNRNPVLKDFNCAISKGEKVAIVGSSGSGKSTVAKLLLKYYEPESGNIFFNGVDIAEYSNTSVRRAISYVPQTIELFSKSIYDNIRVSKMTATLEEVKRAAKEADAHEFISRLPMQYKTYLEEAGNGLSGGEKQRIALARAFLKKSEFYILDESTSNLDFLTENIIFDMIYNKFKDKTMLIVAHRLATIKNCDKIIVLDHGEIIEEGKHEELLKLEGKYKQLWDLQQGIISVNSNNDMHPPENEKAVSESDKDENEISYF